MFDLTQARRKMARRKGGIVAATTDVVLAAPPLSATNTFSLGVAAQTCFFEKFKFISGKTLFGLFKFCKNKLI